MPELNVLCPLGDFSAQSCSAPTAGDGECGAAGLADAYCRMAGATTNRSRCRTVWTKMKTP